MKKYRIRKKTGLNGTVTYYPEQRNVGTLFQRVMENWYAIESDILNFHSTEDQARITIESFKKKIDSQVPEKTEYIEY